MTLLTDIGNSSLHFALSKKGKLIKDFKIPVSALMHTNLLEKKIKKFTNKKERKKITKVLTASVNRKMENLFRKEIFFVLSRLDEYKNITFQDIKKYIHYNYSSPESVGLDRWMNYLGALKEYKHSFIIVDAGSALTLCLVNPSSEFCGGLIAPGANMQAKALHHFTDALPLQSFRKEKSYLGEDTESSISKAVYFSFLHYSKGLIRGLKKQFSKDYQTRPQIIFTGGNGKILYKKLKEKNSKFNKLLSLQGMEYFNRLHYGSGSSHRSG